MEADFVRRSGEILLDGDRPFHIHGANCYYFAWSTVDDQNRILDLVQKRGYNTLRIWAFQDNDTYAIAFQDWPADDSNPVLREGDQGLKCLDRAVQLAGQRGVRLILTLANHLPDFGGVARYVSWLRLNGEREFYEHPRARALFASWFGAITTRRNTLTGIPYASDPTILAWEIINEPRCPWDPTCTKLAIWVAEMAATLRRHAPDQLIYCGDEGFFRRSRTTSWLYNGSMGVDTEALLAIPEVDLASAHLYPEKWAPLEDPVEFGRNWIRQHGESAARARKPFVLGEFGLADRSLRYLAYDAWLEEARLHSAGALVWMIGLPGAGDEFLIDF